MIEIDNIIQIFPQINNLKYCKAQLRRIADDTLAGDDKINLKLSL